MNSDHIAPFLYNEAKEFSTLRNDKETMIPASVLAIHSKYLRKSTLDHFSKNVWGKKTKKSSNHHIAQRCKMKFGNRPNLHFLP